MRQNGTHSTNAIGSRRMNDELIQEMNQDLLDAWQTLTDLLDQTIDLLQRNLEGQVMTMRNSMRGTFSMPYDKGSHTHAPQIWKLHTRW